jgi:hypothetical protein
MIDQDVEMKMSALTAKEFSSARAGFEMRNTRRSRRIRQGSFMLAVAVAVGLAVTACTGGASLDIPIGPVDHACPVENSCAHR